MVVASVMLGIYNSGRQPITCHNSHGDLVVTIYPILESTRLLGPIQPKRSIFATINGMVAVSDLASYMFNDLSFSVMAQQRIESLQNG